MIDNYVQTPLIVEQIGKFGINSLKFVYVDNDLIQECANLGFEPSALRRYLEKNDLNSATTTYYLLQSKKKSNFVDTTTNKKLQ